MISDLDFATALSNSGAYKAVALNCPSEPGFNSRAIKASWTPY
jgi:hypothetical protein